MKFLRKFFDKFKKRKTVLNMGMRQTIVYSGWKHVPRHGTTKETLTYVPNKKGAPPRKI